MNEFASLQVAEEDWVNEPEEWGVKDEKECDEVKKKIARNTPSGSSDRSQATASNEPSYGEQWLRTFSKPEALRLSYSI